MVWSSELFIPNFYSELITPSSELTMASVLVTDGHFRKTLAVVRSLGFKGIDVTVGERTFLNTSFFSKYCSRRLVYPSPRQRPDQFIEFLLNEIKKNHYECVFPMEEETLLLLAKYRSEISRYTYFLSPDLEKIEFVRDKGNLMRFAEAHGIPIPKTFQIPPSGTLPLKEGGEDERYVIKPRISSGSLGIVYVKGSKDLSLSYQSVHQRFPFPIIQEWIPDGGGTYGFSALFDEGSNVKAAFIHKKLRMYPIEGGPSTLGEGVEHPQIMELGLSLLRSLNWVGVGMVEFKVDPRDGNLLCRAIDTGRHCKEEAQSSPSRPASKAWDSDTVSFHDSSLPAAMFASARSFRSFGARAHTHSVNKPAGRLAGDLAIHFGKSFGIGMDRGRSHCAAQPDALEGPIRFPLAQRLQGLRGLVEFLEAIGDLARFGQRAFTGL